MTKKRLVALTAIVMDCYRELYKNATPKANFDKLMEMSPKNDKGQIDIPFMNYGIEADTLDNIIESFINNPKYKMTKREQQEFKNTIYLGCSPKTITRFSLEE
jgi:hypothetical protein